MIILKNVTQGKLDAISNERFRTYCLNQDAINIKIFISKT